MEEYFIFAASKQKFGSKAGFTLAEILITLTVIGVVMAITIPSVIRNYKTSAYKSSFEYAFEFVSRSIKKMNFEEGRLPTKDNYPTHMFKPSFVKYVKVLRDCGLGWDDVDKETKPCVARNKSTSGSGSDMPGYKTYNRKSNIFGEYLDDGQIILLNGMYVFIENYDGYGPIYISVDTNGYTKKPNLWGQDLFTFQLMNDGTVRPMGAPGTTFSDPNIYCSKTSNNNMNGIACAYKAAKDSDYFKDLP